MKLEQFDQASSSEAMNSIVQPAPNATQSQDILTAAKGGGISFMGRSFEYSLRFVLGILVARTVGAEQFGLYTLGYAVISILSILALLGLQTGMLRYLPTAIRQRNEASVWGIIQVGASLPLVLGLALAAGLFLLADPLARQVFQEPRLIPVFRLFCLAVPLDALSFIASTVIQSYKRLEYNVLANNVILPSVKLVLAAGFLTVGLSTLGVVIAHVIASAAALAALVYFVNRLFSLNRPWHAARRNARQLLRYSLPTYPAWVINTVRGMFETLVLGILGLTTEVGIYAAATRFSVIGNMLFLSIAGI